MSQEEHLAHNPDAQPTVSKHWRHERIYTKTNLTAICLTVHLHDITTKHMATSVKLSTAKSMHLQPPNELHADFNLYNIWLIYKNHTPESKKTPQITVWQVHVEGICSCYYLLFIEMQ